MPFALGGEICLGRSISGLPYRAAPTSRCSTLGQVSMSPYLSTLLALAPLFAAGPLGTELRYFLGID